MKDELVSFEVAKLAKEKGFLDIGCLSFYESDDNSRYYTNPTTEYINTLDNDSIYVAPSKSLLQRWLREVHNIHVWCEHQHENLKNVYGFRINGDVETSSFTYSNWTYEEALEKGLQQALELVKIKKIFYRVCNTDSLKGLWYHFDGKFSGLIHTDFDFCLNSKLEMDFDPELVGWLSATDNLEDLWKWFTKEDINRLQEHGWYIHEFEAEDYKFYEKFQHLVIKQDTSKAIKKIEL